MGDVNGPLAWVSSDAFWLGQKMRVKHSSARWIISIYWWINCEETRLRQIDLGTRTVSRRHLRDSKEKSPSFLLLLIVWVSENAWRCERTTSLLILTLIVVMSSLRREKDGRSRTSTRRQDRSCADEKKKDDDNIYFQADAYLFFPFRLFLTPNNEFDPSISSTSRRTYQTSEKPNRRQTCR